MHLSAGISWCPGTNGSHVLIPPLSALGKKNCGGGGCYAGRGVQNKLSQFQPAVTCQRIPTMASRSVNIEARNVPNNGGRVTSERGKVDLHCKSGASSRDLAYPRYILAKKGFS